MDAKSILLSKTIWVNLIAIAAGFLAPKLGITLGATEQVTILGFINLVLRAVTKQPVDWSLPSAS